MDFRLPAEHSRGRLCHISRSQAATIERYTLAA
jgi:hypothetical protein